MKYDFKAGFWKYELNENPFPEEAFYARLALVGHLKTFLTESAIVEGKSAKCQFKSGNFEGSPGRIY